MEFYAAKIFYKDQLNTKTAVFFLIYLILNSKTLKKKSKSYTC